LTDDDDDDDDDNDDNDDEIDVYISSPFLKTATLAQK
jgi:hypothetical protein